MFGNFYLTVIHRDSPIKYCPSGKSFINDFAGIFIFFSNILTFLVQEKKNNNSQKKTSSGRSKNKYHQISDHLPYHVEFSSIFPTAEDGKSNVRKDCVTLMMIFNGEESDSRSTFFRKSTDTVSVSFLLFKPSGQ